MKTILTVCARGGSKGVVGKNLRMAAGLPLIVHTLRIAKACSFVDAFAVSSDSLEILSVAEKEGFTPIQRPDELATDTAAKIPVIRHCVQAAEKKLTTNFDLCLDLDCTSPLRNLEDILGVHRLIQEPKVPNAFTVAPARRSPYFNLVERDADGRVDLAKKLDKPITRRQDAPACFDMNASIYAWKREILEKENTLFLAGTQIFEMPEERSQDVDSEWDFQIVEMMLSRRLRG